MVVLEVESAVLRLGVKRYKLFALHVKHMMGLCAEPTGATSPPASPSARRDDHRSNGRDADWSDSDGGNPDGCRTANPAFNVQSQESVDRAAHSLTRYHRCEARGRKRARRLTGR